MIGVNRRFGTKIIRWMRLETVRVKSDRLSNLNAGPRRLRVTGIILCTLLVGACSQNAWGQATSRYGQTVERRFEEAQKLLRGGDLEKAHAMVREGLKLAREGGNRRAEAVGANLLGMIYHQKKDYDRAETAFRDALRLNPNSIETHINLGKSYFLQKKHDLAEREFLATLSRDSRNRAATYNLGLVCLARGNPEKAITYLRRIESPDLGVSINLSRAYLQTGQTAKALEITKSLSDQAKDNVRLHFSLGILLASARQYQEALHEFESANALAPGTFEILYNLGQAYLRTKNYSRAETVMRRAVGLRPSSAEALYRLAQVYTDQRRDSEALEILVKARRLAPRNTDIIFLMSRVSMMHSYYEDAIRLLEEGVKIAPNRTLLHAALGESYFTAGKIHPAIQEFETLIRLDPSAWSYAFMGLCYRHLGRFEEAKKYLLEGLKVDPRNHTCLFNLGFIESKLGNYDASEKFLQRALQANPNYGEAMYELASVKMAQKNFEEAIPLLRRSAKLMPKPSKVHYKLALAQRALGDRAGAQRDLKIFETLSKDPSPPPYPFSHLFEYVDEKYKLPPRQRAQVDLEDLRKEVERRPNRPRTLYLLAETHLKLGRRDDALNVIAQLEKVSRGDSRTAVGVGVLLARFGLYREAIEYFGKALEADPTSDDARYNLANTYFQLQDFARALEVMEQVGTQARNEDSYLALLGDIYTHLGRTTDAVEIFKEAVRRNSENDQYYLSLALTELRAGQIDAAAETLEEGLAHIPDSGKLYWGLGIVSVLQGKDKPAETYLTKAVDLMPDWQGVYSVLGLFYFESGQIPKAREIVDRYTRMFPEGGLKISRIRQVIEAASQAEGDLSEQKRLSPEARQKFLQLALALTQQGT